MTLDKFLETLGGAAATGFGDRVLIGVIMGALGGPDRCYQYIKEDIQLLPGASDSDWHRLKDLAKKTDIGDLTTDRIISELREHRPDALSVIINHPGGWKWLDRQVAELRKKLGIE